jgi:peptidase S41-like protein
MRLQYMLHLVAIACALGACSTPKASQKPNAETPNLSGVWKSDGYGLIFVARQDTLQLYEVTQTTCVPASKLIRRTTAPQGIEAVYAGDDEHFQVKATPDPDTKRIHSEGTASDIVFHRLLAKPAILDHPTPNTPEGNFEVFARTWAENYILFDEKGADWPATVAKARANITSETQPEALFDILEGMIAPFEDAHTLLLADPIQRRYRGFRKGTDRLFKNGPPTRAYIMTQVVPPILAITDSKLQGPLRTWCNDQVQYGRLDDSTGYLRILSESGYTEEGDYTSGLAALEAALDNIFSDRKLRGLVIDARINMGGADPYGLAIASRLATTKYVAYSKEARMDPVDRTQWTPGQPSMVRPGGKVGFKGPVVELIGPLTISAGETLTQALMGRTPKVIRIGENTQGVFSDILFRTLPNGWHFGLPNEVFRSPEGKTFDGAGIPPDIVVPVFADRDLAAKRDPALERAREELLRQGAAQ